MACNMDTSSPMPELTEQDRRKARAKGTPVTLADGQPWLLANPTYQPGPGSLTRPGVDQTLDRIFDCTVLGERLPVEDLLKVARELLKANYDLSDEEISRILNVDAGDELQTLAARVLDALFGADHAEKTYSAWVRASLIANGLSRSEIPARDLVNVLAVLVATNRTMPLSKFADVCRLVDEQARLEVLI